MKKFKILKSFQIIGVKFNLSCDYIFKVIVVGSPGVGSTSFINNSNNLESAYFNSTHSIGVSFKIVNYRYNHETEIKLQLWDIKASSRFIDLYPHFYKGASGCLLCFDVSNRRSFEQIPNWIKIIRLCRPNIPILLIGTKSDLNYEITRNEINDLAIKFNLDGPFYSSINSHLDRELIFHYLAELLLGNAYSRRKVNNLILQTSNITFQKVRNVKLEEYPVKLEEFCEHRTLEIINIRAPLNSEILIVSNTLDIELQRLKDLIGIGNIENDDLLKLSDEEKILFSKFLDFFSICPVCHRNNHKSYLRKFYFDPNNIRFKNKLLRLMEHSNYFKDMYYNHITLGIPCCDCFKKIYETN